MLSNYSLVGLGSIAVVESTSDGTQLGATSIDEGVYSLSFYLNFVCDCNWCIFPSFVFKEVPEEIVGFFFL